MQRALCILFVPIVAACAEQEHVPAPALPTTTVTTSTSSAAGAAEAIDDELKAPDGRPIVRHGMRARALGDGKRPFATYANRMHDRIHPRFADDGLGKLIAMPAEDPSNDKTLATRLELVVRAVDGHLVAVTVAKPSGVAAFDALAIDSVQRAQPFDAAPRSIRSSDGNVYVDWEFRRDEVYACSTMLTRPFLLRR